MVRKIPAFPFKAPDKHLDAMAIQRFVENPNSIVVNKVPINPITIMGFRPYRSAALPQKIPVVKAIKLKEAPNIPTQNGMSFAGMSNDWIIK